MSVACPPKLEAALDSLPVVARERFMEHLVGGTSSEYLSAWLEKAGSSVKPTTLKDYRRRLNAAQ